MVTSVQKTIKTGAKGQGEAQARRDGNQTLARGLEMFLAIVDAPEGLTVQDASEYLDVHRSIAYRLLQTLSDYGLVARSGGGVYVPGARLATLANSYQPLLRDVAVPIMRELADDLGSTISMFVEQGSEAMAIIMVEPTNAVHHITFKLGMRTPMDRGSAAYALRAGSPPIVDEPPAVQVAREVGFAYSHGEVDPDAYGVAAWVPTGHKSLRLALNLITYREDVAQTAGPAMRRAADKVGRAFTAAT